MLDIDNVWPTAAAEPPAGVPGLLRGEIKYEYEPNGQLHSRDTGRMMDSEQFGYHPAANRLNHGTSKFDEVADNRLKRLGDVEFSYDAWRNTVAKRSGQLASDWQDFEYDAENRLVHSQTLKQSQLVSEGWYQYGSLGRRIKKTSTTPENAAPTEKVFVWQGLQPAAGTNPGRCASVFLRAEQLCPAGSDR